MVKKIGSNMTIDTPFGHHFQMSKLIELLSSDHYINQPTTTVLHL